MAFDDPGMPLEDLNWLVAEEIMQHWVSEDDVKMIFAKDPLGRQFADETLALSRDLGPIYLAHQQRWQRAMKELRKA